MTKFWRALNGRGKAATLGTLLLALSALFAFLNGVPWASKGEVAALRSDVKQELSEIKQDVRQIRDHLLGQPYRRDGR